jgi:hypothetical protein
MKTVVVAEPYQVALDGVVHGPGETVDVPDEVAERWHANGWIEKPKAKAAAKK